MKLFPNRRSLLLVLSGSGTGSVWPRENPMRASLSWGVGHLPVYPAKRRELSAYWYAWYLYMSCCHLESASGVALSMPLSRSCHSPSDWGRVRVGRAVARGWRRTPPSRIEDSSGGAWADVGQRGGGCP